MSEAYRSILRNLFVPIFIASSLTEVGAYAQEASKKGVAYLTDTPKSPDRTASLLIFKQMYERGLDRIFVETNGSQQEVNVSRVRFLIIVPDLDGDFDSPAKIKNLRDALEKLRESKTRFSSGVETVDSLISRIEPIVKELNGGRFFKDGKWLSHEELSNESSNAQTVTAHGKEGGDITDLNGKTYFEVTVFRVDPNGINIRHRGGVVKLSFEILPEELRAQYGYNPEKAAIFSEQEREISRRTNALSDARRISGSGEARVEVTIDPIGWVSFPGDQSLNHQFVEIRFYESKQVTETIARKNALGGAGLPSSVVSTERIYTDRRVVSIIGTAAFLQSIHAGVQERKVFPVVWGSLPNLGAGYTPLIFTFEPEVAARLIAATREGKNTVTLSGLEEAAKLAKKYRVSVFQNLGDGCYLVEADDEIFYLEKSIFPNLSKGTVIAFIAGADGSLFRYQNAFGATRAVPVLKFLSSSVSG